MQLIFDVNDIFILDIISETNYLSRYLFNK